MIIQLLIVEKFQIFESKLDKITDYSNIYEYNVSFESRNKDRCNHSAYLISDDICHILNLLKAHDADAFLFNIKLDQLINLGSNLITRHCLD
jgi:hypothetical protein